MNISQCKKMWNNYATISRASRLSMNIWHLQFQTDNVDAKNRLFEMTQPILLWRRWNSCNYDKPHWVVPSRHNFIRFHGIPHQPQGYIFKLQIILGDKKSNISHPMRMTICNILRLSGTPVGRICLSKPWTSVISSQGDKYIALIIRDFSLRSEW